jgi:hypothetical protein
VSVLPGSLRGHTVPIVRLTPFRFDLNGRVVDVKPMFNIVHDGTQYLLPFADTLLGHDDVTAAGNDTLTDHPQIVSGSSRVHTENEDMRAGSIVDPPPVRSACVGQTPHAAIGV